MAMVTESIDQLISGAANVVTFRGPRLPGTPRGTGWVLVVAIAAGLARELLMINACRARATTWPGCSRRPRRALETRAEQGRRRAGNTGFVYFERFRSSAWLRARIHARRSPLDRTEPASRHPRRSSRPMVGHFNARRYEQQIAYYADDIVYKVGNLTLTSPRQIADFYADFHQSVKERVEIVEPRSRRRYGGRRAACGVRAVPRLRTQWPAVPGRRPAGHRELRVLPR